MKLVADRKGLVAAMRTIQRVCSTKRGASEGANLARLSLAGNTLTIKADSGNVYAAMELIVAGEENGVAAVDASMLASALASGGEDIRIETNAELMKAGDVTFPLDSSNAIIVVPEEMAPENRITTTGDHVARIVATAKHAICKDTALYKYKSMSSLLIVPQADARPYAVATDGHRMVIVGERHGDAVEGIMIPSSMLPAILAIDKKQLCNSAVIHSSDVYVEFSMPGIRIGAPRPSQEFPRWHQVVPQPGGGIGSFAADRLNMIAACKACKPFTSKSHPQCSLKLNQKSGAIHAEDGLGKKAHKEFGCGILYGKPVSITLPLGFLADALNVMEDANVVITFYDISKPVTVSCGDVLELIMPYRNKGE